MAAGDGLGLDSTAAGDGLSLDGTATGADLGGTAAGNGLGLVGGEPRGLPVVVGWLWLIPGVAGGRAESGSVEDWPKGGGDAHKPALHHYREVSRLPWSGPRLRD